MKNIKLYLLIVGILTGLSTLKGQDFVYTPINPAFGGGYTYNYNWLLSSAEAQNNIQDPNQKPATDPFASNPLADFQNNLNRQILNELSQKIIQSQFGESGLTTGQYTLGNYQVNINSASNGINVVVTDNSTGNETTVVVPYF